MGIIIPCPERMKVPQIVYFIKTDQSKGVIEVKDQKSVCMNINGIITKNIIGSNEIKNAETTFTFLD